MPGYEYRLDVLEELLRFLNEDADVNSIQIETQLYI